MGRNWTENQLEAINSRNGSVLVSAAAGSGKTAVLVERVIRRITDEKNKCLADSLLIVTFTRAAAGEMRERISAALSEKLKKDPKNAYIRQQQILLPDAQICTIDSFCSSLVRENFQLLGISPDFRIADESELSLFNQQAMDKMMEDEYAKNEPDFTGLVELLFKGRDDKELTNCIYSLYEYSRAYPFPDEWLNSILSIYENGADISSGYWGRAVMDYALSAAEYCKKLNESMKNNVQGDDALTKAYGASNESDSALIENIIQKLRSNDWNGASAAVNADFSRRGNLPRGMNKTFEAISLEEARKEIKSIIKEKLAPLFCVTEEENRSDNEFFYPSVKKLIECVHEFSDILYGIKTENGCFDFADISHFALSLLVTKENGNVKRTPLAESLCDRYAEILIDEYQDTNLEQDMIFRAVSCSEQNLFRVGDVKQSIYSFRQAMPEIFINLRNSLKPFKGNNYPCKVNLDKNFRSRRGVTAYINFIFSLLMSEKSGGVDYDKGEELVCGAKYPETEFPEAELHVIDSDEASDGSAETVLQARYVASMVNDILRSGRTVTGADGVRPVRKSDICILLRSVKTGGTIYADALRSYGIDCFTQASVNFFSTTEISVMLSLLRVIDNPVQDVALMSVMMSPIFSFTPDEMAKLRLKNRRGSIYSCLIKAGESDEKVAGFLRFFRRMRFLAATCTTSALIRRIYDETSYTAIVRAMKGGEVRCSNLWLLVDYAVVYEKSGMLGLSGFIRFIDKLCKSKKELDSSNTVSENADVVRIMTIHKSKGLEFPICILAGAQRSFNLEDERKNMIINPKYGVGLIRRDAETMSEYETLPHTAAKLQTDVNAKNEEMRILYVALTRAREDLIIVTSVKNLEKKLIRLSGSIVPGERKVPSYPIISANNYSDWILRAMLRHRDCRELRSLAGIGEDAVIHSDFSLKLNIVKNVDTAVRRVTVQSDVTEIDTSIQKFISDRVNFKYKYASLSSIPTKRAASEFETGRIDRENFATKKPAFLERGELTPAQIGTATHKFMQFADFSAANESVEREIERLCRAGTLTEKEGEYINRRKLKAFFDSSLAARILKSPMVLREKKFTVALPVRTVYPDADFENETVMVQGIVDCAFLENGKLVLVDYKTDKVSNVAELSEKYRGQIEIYKYALEQMTEFEVGESCLYSFGLSTVVKL